MEGDNLNICLESNDIFQKRKSKFSTKVSGGSTALVAIFICDRLFVANAGDSRAVVYKSGNQYAVS